jgi:hypothetical protein
VAAVEHQFELGVDGVILHGASPSDLRPIIEAWSSEAPPRCADPSST